MAIQAEQTLYNGSVVTYHKINGYMFLANNGIDINVHSFLNQAHRSNSYLPTHSCDINFTFNGNISTLPQQAYTYLKSLPQYPNAIDV